MFDFIKKLFSANSCNKRCCGGSCVDFDAQIELNLTEEDLEVFKNLDENIVIGKVMSLAAHPDPKVTKVRVTKTNVGNEELQILCGGVNLAVGDIVPVAKVGTKLSEDFEIGERSIRGEKSLGMICARAELGLSPNEEKKGEIWKLPEVCEKMIEKSLRACIKGEMINNQKISASIKI